MYRINDAVGCFLIQRFLSAHQLLKCWRSCLAFGHQFFNINQRKFCRFIRQNHGLGALHKVRLFFAKNLFRNFRLLIDKFRHVPQERFGIQIRRSKQLTLRKHAIGYVPI